MRLITNSSLAEQHNVDNESTNCYFPSLSHLSFSYSCFPFLLIFCHLSVFPSAHAPTPLLPSLPTPHTMCPLFSDSHPRKQRNRTSTTQNTHTHTGFHSLTLTLRASAHKTHTHPHTRTYPLTVTEYWQSSGQGLDWALVLSHGVECDRSHDGLIHGSSVDDTLSAT